MLLPKPDPKTSRAREPFARAAFVVLWTTGPDPAIDRLVRIQAWKSGPGVEERPVFDRFVQAREESDDPDRAADRARDARSFGIDVADLEAASALESAWPELLAFVGDGPIVVPDGESFATWCAHATGSRADVPVTLGLAEIAALFLPGRLATRRAGLVAWLAGADERAFGPMDLHAATLELVRRVHALDESALRLAAVGYSRAWSRLSVADPLAASRLQLALALLDRPSAWAQDTEIEDGRIVAYAREGLEIEDLLEDARPRCVATAARGEILDPVPCEAPGEDTAFDDVDMETLDRVFEQILPRGAGPGLDARATYRPSQHQVAREVARTLGSRELLLVHAPTGTGKTLSYLVPAMLWARRRNLRVGIATYTRALQEQAMDREVPRALSLLARAGVADGTRVSVLKGRENYVCWRALKLAVPDEDSAEAWLAWTVLAIFAVTDAEGDLDRLPMRSPLTLASSEPFVNALRAVVRAVRSRTGCCSDKSDRETCAAEVARRRAERSHVVIINQAFALARQEFFKHVVFDECEHLHEQAHSAWSKSIGFRDLRSLASRLRQPGRPHSRAVLDRLERALLEGTPSHEAHGRASEAWDAFRGASDALEAAVTDFERWREAERRRRETREEHSMLREYVLGHDAEPLVLARVEIVRAGNELDSALAELLERVDQIGVRGIGRVRRAVDVARTDLNTVLDVLAAWIPLDEGRPAFRPRTFYDVERDARGDVVLCSRVLLPNEFLGRNYYPSLSSAVFLSATTWLQDGFTAARAYLGLDRAAEPAEDEEREPARVRTFRAPDVFDYRRVLVAVPRDAPSVSAEKDAFLDYVRRFVAHLSERTRGRMLCLFTNASDVKRVGEDLTGFCRARRIPLWFQNMEGTAKEELADLFRSSGGSILFGVDTFWFGADFPGETLEYLVIVRLPYGVPDRYHHAQCAAIGATEQRRQIYLPRALAKFRQGFGRLMRRESDRGCVFVLDGRVLEPKHRMFLRELPLQRGFEAGTQFEPETAGARLVRGETDHCLHEALAHMGLLEDVKRRGLDWRFDAGTSPSAALDDADGPAPKLVRLRREPAPSPLEIPPEDVPF